MSNDHALAAKAFVVTRRPRLADVVDHPKLDFADYERRLASLQGVLQLIQQAYLGTPERAIIVLEGWDTAGKGGVVRRLGWALDPRSFGVSPIASPDEHERAQHYLQRFWRRLPENGHIVAFDRSWYGRVLVERVEGFATEKDTIPTPTAAQLAKPGIEGFPPVSNELSIVHAEAGAPLVYYFGAGWSKSGDFPEERDWENYVRQFSGRLKAPLAVTLR